ncbi:hypothetical protein BDW22DRAFT_1427234 [Trametopsis cervina]|nr:hypothetical protein BDW22DRAFT_1427234 [Trametopsis cervina]
MRSSAVLALAFIATAGPALAAPISARSSHEEFINMLARAEVDESGALRLPTLSEAASAAGIAASLTGVFNGIAQHFGNKDKREILEMLARAEVDESGALRLPTLAEAASAAGIAASLTGVFNGIAQHFGNNNKREILEMLARADVDESDALSLKSISSILGIGNLLSGFFGGGNSQQQQQQRREFIELLTRADESEALSIPPGLVSAAKNLGHLASGGLSAFGIFQNLFGGNSNQQQQREILELFARADVDDESDALSLKSISSILGIGNLLSGFFGGGNQQQQQQRRELLDMLTRADETEALSIPSGLVSAAKNFGHLASSALSAFGIFNNLSGGDQQQQRREIDELFARDDASEALSLRLPTLAEAASAAGIAASLTSVFNGIAQHFGNKDKREILEILARADVDESDALSLKSISSILGIGNLLSGFFGGGSQQQQQQRREFVELLTRADESEALSIPPGLVSAAKNLGHLASGGLSAFGIFQNLFGGNNNQQQQREILDLFTRADESEALSIPPGLVSAAKNLGHLASGGLSALGIFQNLFGNNNQQQQRELAELFARADVDESDALSLKSISSILNVGNLLTSFFGGGNSQQQQQQRRELAELLARADDSQALSIPPGLVSAAKNLGHLASGGLSALGIFQNLFGNNNQQQQRELAELFARADIDESDALSLKSISSILGIGNLISGFFGGGNQQQQQSRELAELLARADESEALSIPPGLVSAAKNIGHLASSGLSAFGIFQNLFGGNNNQQQQRELVELLSRADADGSEALSIGDIFSTLHNIFNLRDDIAPVARSLNDLD